MTHLSVQEWGRVPVGEVSNALSRGQADALLASARAHPCGGEEGTNILIDHHRYLRAQQVVGVLAAPGCSLEILPKIDPGEPSGDSSSLRALLVHMLDVALGLELSAGANAAIARQSETLLDILIRLFADRLTAETRRGLPRLYFSQTDDLPVLRGRLNIVRQFTTLAVRPEKVACGFDTLSVDTPLLQVMKACVVFLMRYARLMETRRRLSELRLVLADVQDVQPAYLPWNRIRIDRTNRRWQTLHDLARLFLRRDWLATHHDPRRAEGVTLLFPMNDLFESYVAALMRKALAPKGYAVISQGGLRYCLGDWQDEGECRGTLFQTKPDILVRKNGAIIYVVDTKWKILSANIEDRKRGVAQADVYQMMAYSQLYDCKRLMLLYPHHAQLGFRRLIARHGVAVPGGGHLDVATVAVSGNRRAVEAELAELITASAAGTQSEVVGEQTEEASLNV